MPGQVTGSGLIPVWVLPTCPVRLHIDLFRCHNPGASERNQSRQRNTDLFSGDSPGNGDKPDSRSGYGSGISKPPKPIPQSWHRQLAQLKPRLPVQLWPVLPLKPPQQGRRRLLDATQTSAVGTLQAVAATETIAAYQTSVATQQTPTFTPTFLPSLTPTILATLTPTQQLYPVLVE